MWFKKFLRFITPALVLGAILILGFLAFSGIYVLSPILGLAITAFVLSVVIEGEIYYQNISKAIKNLTKTNYIESKLAEECLKEAYEDILVSSPIRLLNAIDDFQSNYNTLISANHGASALKQKKLKILQIIKELESDKKYSQIYNVLKEKINEIKPYLEDSVCIMVTNKPRKSPEILKKLQGISPEIKNLIPKFFLDYAQIATVDHTFSHINPTDDAKKTKEYLEINLSILEKIFTEQLFPHTQKQKLKSNDPANDAEDKYTAELCKYLQERYYTKYYKMLPRRKFGSKFIKILSSACALLMMLGTSYLLVEAFAVVPVLATIPFGILPVIIVPLAVLAGIAYGMQTYRALDIILNGDTLSQRLTKIRTDIKQGLNLYTGAKLIVFFALLGLAITLTICTAGTWYTVIKHTKPLFSWLSKIPSAVSSIIAGFLAIAAFAFNITNSAQTAEELEEAVEGAVPEDNPYNIDLITLDLNNTESANRIAIRKDGNGKYFIKFRVPGTNNWQEKEVGEKSFFLKMLLNRIEFDNKVLYYSVFNSLLYILIRFETAHQFIENWTQFANPFRWFLLFTYVPLRIIIFLGHLASISATADRIPGVPEVISMIIGFIAELFEDLHYFTTFESKHNADLSEVIGERFREEGGCEHANDLPTRILRDYIFYPFFSGAAWWHSRFSDEIALENDSAKKIPSITYAAAYEILRGKKPKTTPPLPEKIVPLINSTKEYYFSLQKNQALNKEDFVEIEKQREDLINFFSKNKHKDFSVFARKDSCCQTSGNNCNTHIRSL